MKSPIRREALLGTEGNYGEQLGLTKDWAYRIIKHVGNYGEVFEKNVGQGSPLKIARGVNTLDQGRPAIRPADPPSTRISRTGRVAATRLFGRRLACRWVS
jgi:hypothetical protein